MDLFEDPETKKTYDKCKYIVKVWEHKFIKKYRRIPSKLDIREAPQNVRHAYRKYFQLKTAALEQSFIGVEGFEEEVFENLNPNSENNEDNNSVFELHLSNDNFTEVVQEGEKEIKESVTEENEDSKELIHNDNIYDDVWGSHLNKKKVPVEDDNTKDKTLSLPVQSITKKLFCGSKFNKRNPRKSLSFSQKKHSDVSSDSPSISAQPTFSMDSFKSEEAFSFLETDSESSFLEKTAKLAGPESKIYSQPLSMSLLDNVLDNKQKCPLKQVDLGWLKRITDNTGVSLNNPELSSQNSLCFFDDVSTKTNNGALETKVDYDSDDIVEDSDEEQNNSRNTSIFHIAKKSRISLGIKRSSLTVSSQKSLGKNDEDKLNKINLKENITDNIPRLEMEREVTNKEDILNASNSAEEKCITKESCKEIQIGESLAKFKTLNLKDGTPKKLRKNTVVHTQRGKKIKKTKSLPKSSEDDVSNSESPSLRRSARSTIVKASFEELPSEEEDPFASDNDKSDPEFNIESEKYGEKRSKRFDFSKIQQEIENNLEDKKTEKRRKKSDAGKSPRIVAKRSSKMKRKEENEASNIEENAKYELEFNAKPRIVAPRYSSIKTIIKKKLIEQLKQPEEESDLAETIDKTQPKNKKQQAKEKLEQKIAAGNLNDNFVTINLRKKVFLRGKKGHNFSKYKKALWKSKKKSLYGPDMDMGGCDGGKLVCFNCGQEGHFAQRCKAEKGDGLLPLTPADEEEECPFPTLEDASKMATDSVLSIRKPKILLQKNKDRTEDGNSIAGAENKDEGGSSDEEEEWTDDIDEEILIAEAEKLEEHVKKLDVQIYMDTVKVVEPYYGLKEDGNIIDTTDEVYRALAQFGHGSFRKGQERAIMRILSGKSTLVTLSTGSGKSLCYQLPAYLYSLREPCISLVISPLVSLMEDQITGIPSFLKAACLHTNQTASTRQKIMEALAAGDINVLLISPEAVVAGEKQTGFGSLFRKLPPIAFACIDEAHCVSQWSHNFRPSYLMICRVLRESLGVKTILGLTATATRATCQSIIGSLDIPDGLDGIISDTPLPDNLFLSVSKDASRDRALLNLLLSDRFKDCKSIIVYCTRREECERIAAFLRTSLKSETVVESTNKKRKRLNLQAEPYHAGLSASRRRSVQKAFMSGELRVVVATVAFGMGINKSDIRAVIHFNMPNSFESYVQEVGRAGRDGLPAHCHVFLDSQGRDENELRRHIHTNSIERHVIRKLLQKIFVPCYCSGVCPKHEVAFSIEQTVRMLDIPEENISTLLCYLELHDNKYIELLNPGYTACKIISYGGPLQILKASKDCPPLAMALALHPGKDGEDNILEFPVVDVASAMGWDSGICKHKLKNLEWVVVNNQPKRSALSVQFTNLGFRLLAPGNLTDEQLDEALDSLYNKVVNQESKALKQLHAVHETLLEVAEKSYMSCIKVDSETNSNTLLKNRIREYFNSSDPLANIGDESPKKINEDQIINDVRAMISMYRDNQFTGRAIARIFHGIQSPNYPAVMWGRCKFWRSHINEDFHQICRIATREIIKMR